ncbi:MAG: signal peptidase I [Proteobacteria bacterium]|nr:signal peptidase I [Pseudomonadota bacterium]
MPDSIEQNEVPGDSELIEDEFFNEGLENSARLMGDEGFHSAPTVEMLPENNAVATCILGFLSPGTHLSVRGKISLCLCVNLSLAMLFITGPLLCHWTGLFPVPILIMSVVLVLMCWMYSVVQVFRHPPVMSGRFEPWAHAGLAFLSYWLPLAVCFFMSSNFVTQRTWLGNDTMNPSMMSGDYILVDKLAYRRTAPEYGDPVLVEESWQENNTLKRRAFFARIIAKPGDSVQLSGYVPHVNGKPLSQFHKTSDNSVYERPIVTFELPHHVTTPENIETEPEKWYPVITTNQLLFTQTNTVKLDPDYYFVLEDNRDPKRERVHESYGSIVKRNEIHGRPVYIIYNNKIENGFSRYGLAVR